MLDMSRLNTPELCSLSAMLPRIDAHFRGELTREDLVSELLDAFPGNTSFVVALLREKGI